MSDNVLKLVPDEMGEHHRLDAADLLEAAKGTTFHRLAIIGQTEDGDMYLTGTANAGETLILLERAKHSIVFDC